MEHALRLIEIYYECNTTLVIFFKYSEYRHEELAGD